MTVLRSAHRLLEAMRIRPRSLALLATAAACQALLQAPIPFLIQRAFTFTVSNGSLVRLATTIGWMVALLLASEGTSALVRIAALRVTKPGTLRLRGALTSAITALPIDLVEPRSPYLHDVYVHDTDRVDTLVTSATGQMLPALLLVAGLSAALAIPHPAFGLATLTAAAVVAATERVTRRRVRRQIDRAHHTFGEFSRGAWSMLSGFLVTRAHAAERYEAGERAGEAEAARHASEDAAQAAALSNFIGRAVAAIVFSALLLLAGVLVQRGSMTIPAMLAVTSTIALLRAPLFTLGQIAPQVQEGWRAWERIAALLDAAADIPHGDVLPPDDTTLTIDDLDCRRGRSTLFRHVSFTIAPGEVVAITGPNGTGKTTLVRHILGLTMPTSGTIRVGGVPIDRLDLVAWRRLVGVVLQETWFFDGSILANLTYGVPSASGAAVETACRLAHVDDLVRQLPAGLDTMIGTGGLRLSEGQRQRLAIARALVRRPRLLILDEPTNHLDEAAARGIVHALVNQPDRPAILIITHQPEFAAVADRGFRFAGGELTAIDRLELAAAAAAALAR